MEDLAGRTLVVTGAGSGIGRGYCLAFAEAGMNVVAADLDRAAAEETVELVKELGVDGLAVQVDVSDPASMQALADEAYGRFGTVDVICLNAGIGHYRPFHETPHEVWRRMVDVNIFGSVNGMLAFWDRLRAQEGEKHVVVTSSAAGIVPRVSPPRTAYQTTKYALVGFCESMAAEGEPYGIGFTCVCPGPVTTALGANSRRQLGQPDPPPVAPDNAPRNSTEGEHRMTPLEVGHWVRRSVERGEFWSFTHFELGPLYEARSEVMRDAFGQSKRDYDADEAEKAAVASSSGGAA